MASRQAVLGMEQASFYYGSGRVFEGVSFLLDDARTALVGENGAGKSTLLKCLLGALELNGGQVIRSRGLRTGSVPQDVSPGLDSRPVRDVLHDSLARAGHDGEDWRVDVLADEIGVEPEVLDRPFGTLSGGWQRLLLIAAAARLVRSADADRQPRPRVLEPGDRTHPVPAQRRGPRLQDPLLAGA
jgi:ATPase subunit of ABC transporter with duplicated ATPase domains